MPSLSIIIINYNTFDLTSKCLTSVYENLSFDEVEVILVDNASTEKDANLFLEKFPNLILIKSPENIGFAKGNNLGIARASNQYILLLNSDAFVRDASTFEGIDFLEQNPNVAVVTGKLLFPDGKIQHNCQSFPSIIKSTLERLRFQKIMSKKRRANYFYGFYGNYNDIMYPDWVWGAYFLFDKSKLKSLKNGKLAEDFFMYIEDMQWCYEFRALGFEIAYLPQIEITHVMGGSSGNKNDMLNKNYNTFLYKYYTGLNRYLLKK